MEHLKSLIVMSGTALALAALVSCGNRQKASRIDYPQARTENVTDNYFGTEVSDPYRWMENDTTAEVKAWVDAENKITGDYLSRIPFRDRLRQRFTALSNYEKIGVPDKKHGRYYFFKNDGLQNQSVLYVKETLDSEAKVVLDPNTLSDDGTVALSNTSFSKDGRYLAYGISRSGSDWLELFVIDLETGRQLDDHIRWAKLSGAVWSGDGFFYCAYDAPEEGKEFSNVNEYQKVYYHAIGTPQSADRLVYENKQYPKRFYYPDIDTEGRFLFISESGHNTGNRLFIRDLNTPGGEYTEITSDDRYEYIYIETIGDCLYFITNNGAPRYRIMKAKASAPQFAHWTEVVPESANVLENVTFAGDKMILTYMKDAADHAYLYTVDGQNLGEITLPSLGSVSFSGNKGDKEVFYSFSSFTQPATIYKYDMDSNTSALYLAPKTDFASDDYETRQVFYTSKDGTSIPMFIVHRKGLVPDGNTPVLLYGYGGFNISLTPSFAVSRLPFLEEGGIFALANLRGGGEYGEEWHLAGTKMNKQNVFDDFIAAAEYLIDEGYTNPDKICIMGGSNGGLLVGAVVNQRPDLFAVALPAVGVMDMLRYHRFTIGWNWASDYGTSDDSPEMFTYLHGYSPLHTIRNDGTDYPAILVTTADHDDRVVPAHSFKYTATLQAADTGDAPKLIRIDSKAGHGAGKPISKQIDEWTDTYSFAFYNLGMTVK
ncbi:MAG: S9 family peptidase [bacterium]|uniref:prolyl oligopeptidase n=1 Tax=Candidatus Aphodosoma intestinipullorum TaxID=2840674 RepID=A0A940DIR9_9BACT|nr:S9 family peptidase [Candidatus Aphodosoma intestinipullorum]